MTLSVITDRKAARARFLADAGWGNAPRFSMGQDASTRSYLRLLQGGQRAILMDAPPAAESAPCGADADTQTRINAGWNARTRLAACRVDAFVGIANYLRSLGLSAPEVYAFDVEGGFALIEDLGDGVFARLLEADADEHALYMQATDCLAMVHNAPPPAEVSAGPFSWPILPYDRLALSTGADLFPKWYPRYDDRVRISGALARDLDDIVFGYCEHLASLPQIFMLRDYHAENLLWLPERDGNARVGILDFQDAVRGPAAWDLAMFVQDARRDVSPDVQAAIVRRYVEQTGQDEESFLKDLAMAGAVNALRILGVFARLIHRDGKTRYGAFLEREWGHLEDSVSHPSLADLRQVLAAAVPHREGLK